MLQALLVVPGVRAGLPGRRADDAAPAGACTCSAPGWRWWCRPAGGWRSSSWCPASWRPYIGGSQTNSGVGADLGLQRPGPADRRRDRQRRRAAARHGARPASAGCSPPRSAARSPGCCPRRWCCCVAGLVARRPGAAHRPAPGGAAALGRLAGGHRRWSFSLMAGIFHAYYTVALAPAIAALVGIGGGLLWQRRGARLGADRAGADPGRHRRSGRGCCSTGPPTSYPG